MGASVRTSNGGLSREELASYIALRSVCARKLQIVAATREECVFSMWLGS